MLIAYVVAVTPNNIMIKKDNRELFEYGLDSYRDCRDRIAPWPNNGYFYPQTSRDGMLVTTFGLKLTFPHVLQSYANVIYN